MKTEVEEKLGKDIAKVAFNQAMKNKWLKADKTTIERIVQEAHDPFHEILKHLLDD